MRSNTIDNSYEIQILENYPLAPLTTFKIGGSARYFAAASTLPSLLSALTFARSRQLPIKIIGGGSNLLISDKGFDGLVIQIKLADLASAPSLASSHSILLDSQPPKTDPQNSTANIWRADAGCPLSRLVSAVVSANLDLSWAAGIPGTVGGAIRGNAGAFGADCARNILSVDYIDLAQPEKILILAGPDCAFAYRHSIFKTHPDWLIISSLWQIPPADPVQIQDQISAHLAYRHEHQPLEYPSAGSVFKNPPLSPAYDTDLSAAAVHSASATEFHARLAAQNFKDVIPAAWLIEQAGLKGKIIGQAQISPKHANFIVNLGGASAQNVLDLIREAQAAVYAKFLIPLEPEVELWGF